MATDTAIKDTKSVVPSEIGNTGLIVDDGYVREQAKYDLVFPKSIRTFDEMSENIAIGSVLNAVDIVSSRVPLYLEPYDQTTTHKNRMLFVDECFNDMEHSLFDFIREVMSFNRYGFCVNEKVFRFRRKEKGSKYNDGKVGIKKLPIRSQDSILKWKFSTMNREILGVYQKVPKSVLIPIKQDGIFIPRDRFMLFRVNPRKGNPEGVSPLVTCYKSWRKLQKLLDSELIATSKNLNGVPLLTMPAAYMAEDAPDAMAQVYDVMKECVSNIAAGEQTAAVIPSDRDPDSEGKLFDLQLLSASASNISAISTVIQRYTNEIYQALFADVLQMGGDADKDADFLNMLVETRVKEILEVVNKDLIPDLFRRNGWDETKTPKLKHGSLSKVDMAVFAKALQQLKATKLIAVTPENINYIAEQMGLPERISLDVTKKELDDILGVEEKDDSRSGDGAAKGAGNGTSDEVSEEDNSANNLSNK